MSDIPENRALEHHKTQIAKDLENFSTYVSHLIESNKALTFECERLKTEQYKDQELAKMKSELDELRKEYDLGFPMTQEECDAITAWKTKHENEKHGGYPAYFGAIGGNYTYKFVGTSIGICGSIECSCGECFNFREL